MGQGLGQWHETSAWEKGKGPGLGTRALTRAFDKVMVQGVSLRIIEVYILRGFIVPPRGKGAMAPSPISASLILPNAGTEILILMCRDLGDDHCIS